LTFVRSSVLDALNPEVIQQYQTLSKEISNRVKFKTPFESAEPAFNSTLLLIYSPVVVAG